MKKTLRFFVACALFLSFSYSAFSQSYCTPPPYQNGPFTGITNVTLEGLNNSTTYNGGYTYYSSVTGPSLQQGGNYTVYVTTEHNLTGQGFSDQLNTRVWIDWNADFDFDDAGEEVGLWNGQIPGQVSQAFTVPSGAVVGITRMRVYTDMREVDGHITPEPCGYLNHPQHSLGHHGEVEDYDVTITPMVGNVDPIVGASLTVYNQQDGALVAGFELTQSSNVSLKVFNTSGQLLQTAFSGQDVSGMQRVRIEDASSGMLIIQLEVDGVTYTKKAIRH